MSWQITKLPISGFAANCYWLENQEEALLIDPCAWPEKKPHSQAKLMGLVATHGHLDHILTVDDWRDSYQVPLYIHEEDAHMLEDSRANASYMFGRPLSWRKAEHRLTADSIFEFADGSVLSLIHTPGHTMGSICLLLRDGQGQDIALFTGDTVFADSVGRTDLGGSDQDLLRSIDLIKGLLTDDNATMMVYPGHGPQIELGDLCQSHPWLSTDSYL